MDTGDGLHKLQRCSLGNTLADAILDRLMHNAQRLDMKGESMRKRLAQVD